MRSDYKERREAKADRAAELAAKATKESEARHKAADQQSGAFYMGQPILVGHHSEGPARKLQAKMHNNIRKGVALEQKADYYQDRADRLEKEPYAISSDDPEALQKLQQRLENTRWIHSQMKQGNAAWRAYNKKGEVAFEKYPELSQKTIQAIMAFVPKYSWEKGPYEAYNLTAENAKIKSIEERIRKIEALNARPDREYEINDIRIVENATENRVQMFFDGKPSEETITTLKRSGFRYAGSIGCWQRQYSDASIRLAKDIAEDQK